ncbi:MAG TPA: glycosyltransferase family 2 protein [Bacillota bacterium]|nr:glycosyltransferase family 2 protein [Bacillota bacterium]
MNDKNIVSVIIAVYNIAPLLKKCIVSITEQTYDDLEIIIVNDGSTDNSLEICKEYAKTDARIKIVDKKNEGIEKARLTGLEHAHGEWVRFVDGDDWLPKRSIEILVENALKYDADVVVGTLYRVIDKYALIRKKSVMHAEKTEVIDNATFMEKYYRSFFGVNIVSVGLCEKLYRREVIVSASLHAVGVTHSEDLNFNVRVMPLAKKIVWIPDNVYYYRYGGMTNRVNPRMMDDACTSYSFRKPYVQRYSVPDGELYLACELKNFLYTFAVSLTVFNAENASQLVAAAMAKEELKEAVRICIEKGRIGKQQGLTILNGDADGYIKSIAPDIDRAKKLHKIKKTAVSILQHL